MGLDLHNRDGGYFGCSGAVWVVYRTVAQEYGWEPRGPRYDEAERQHFSEADAFALGAALDRALESDELPAALRRAWGGNWDEEVWEMQVESDRTRLAELRAFCRGGEFRMS